MTELVYIPFFNRFEKKEVINSDFFLDKIKELRHLLTDLKNSFFNYFIFLIFFTRQTLPFDRYHTRL